MKVSYYMVLFLFLLLIVSLPLVVQGQSERLQRDTAAWATATATTCTSLSTEKIMTQRCPWSESLNAASLLCVDCRDRVASAWMGFSQASGDYRLFQEAEEASRYGFYTKGWSAVGNWRFYGNFSYYNETGKQVRWVDVIEPYNGNPYTVGDSVGGDYSREYFLMEGKAALPLGNHWAAGFDVKYKAGVGTKRKDPRPENSITDFEISPGIIWSSGRWKVGGNFRYETGKEDIEFSSVTGNKFDLFYYRGLGAFSTTMEDDGRYTETELFGGGIQANYGGTLFNNVTSASISRQTTGIKRGSTYPLQVVFLDNYTTEASTLFLFRPEEVNINRLKIWYFRSKTYGEEPVVEPRLEEVSWQWSTAAKYTLYWQETTNVGARWSYYKVRDPNHVDWGGSLGTTWSNDETTYYFVPEFNRQKINRFTTEALLEKGFLSGVHQLVLSLNGGYRFSPSHSLEVVNDEKLRRQVHLDFVEHDYFYQTVDVWETGITVDYGREFRTAKSPFQFFLEAGFNRISDDFTGTTARNSFRLNAGINF